MITWFKRLTLLIVVLAVSSYTVLFTLINSQRVDVDFIFFEWLDARFELAFLASFVLGGVLGLLSAWGFVVRAHIKAQSQA